MSKCVDVTPAKQRVCAGAFKYKVGIFNRKLRGLATQENASHSEEYIFVRFIYCSIETKKGQVLQTLDGVAINPQLTITHTFTTRFLPDITTEHFVQFLGVNYKILKVENIDEEGRWSRLGANLRGDATKAGAL